MILSIVLLEHKGLKLNEKCGLLIDDRFNQMENQFLNTCVNDLALMDLAYPLIEWTEKDEKSGPDRPHLAWKPTKPMGD